MKQYLWWHKIHHLKKMTLILSPLFRCIFLLVTICFLSLDALFSQTLTPQNLQKYDKQRIHFGFLIGFNISNLIVKPIANFNSLDSLYVINSTSGPGFHFGALANLRLGEHFDLRIYFPQLSFCQRNLQYTFYSHDSLKVSYPSHQVQPP